MGKSLGFFGNLLDPFGFHIILEPPLTQAQPCLGHLINSSTAFAGELYTASHALQIGELEWRVSYSFCLGSGVFDRRSKESRASVESIRV